MSMNPVAQPASLLQPDLLASQFSGGGAVNKFRGDVTMPLPLTSLAGVQGVGIALTAINSSSVFRAARMDNAQAPTSILGLGWELPRERIVVMGKRSTAIMSGVHAVEQNGNLSPLTLIENAGSAYLFVTNALPLWQFKYSPSDETWTVTLPDGGKRYYGGGTTAGACEWGLSWTGWIGASTAPNATPYVVAWNLARIESAWGLRLNYTYDADTLPVGAAGSYTRASYLTWITDDLGQAVELTYWNKESFEWVCPHLYRGEPDTAYQDRYETKFLKYLVEYSNLQSATKMRRLTFDYRFDDPSGIGQDVYKKRVLVKISVAVNDIAPSPDTQFDYVTDHAAPAAGALAKILNPSGSTTTFDYKTIKLNADDNPYFNKTLPIAPPPGFEGARPYLLPSEAFMALTWLHPTRGTATVQIYNYGGAWSQPWSPDGTISGSFDADGIGYAQAGDKFALLLPPTTGGAGTSVLLFLFRRDPYRDDVWHADKRTIRLTASVDKVSGSFIGGDNFIALALEGQGRFQIYNFDPSNLTWQETSFTPSGENIALSSDGSRLMVAAIANATRNMELTLYSRALDLSWARTGGPIYKNGVTWSPPYVSSLLNCGPNFCAVTYTDGSGGRLDLLKWDGQGKFSGERTFPAATAATQVSESVVINGPRVFRYDAGDWKGSTFTDDPNASYVIGDDFALRTLAIGAPAATLIRYEPAIGDWISESLPDANATIFPPTLSRNIMTCGTKVYRRQPDETWLPIADLSTSGDPATLVNRGEFVIYVDRQPAGKKRVVVLLLGDDREVETVYFDNQLFGGGAAWFSAGACAGPRCFATYPEKIVPTAPSSLLLNRILNNSLSQIQEETVVGKMTTNDGYQTYATAYDYDNISAIFNPTGQIAQFPFVTETPLDAAGRAIGGRVESRFYNGLAIPDEPELDAYHSLATGREYETNAFTADGLRIFGRETHWQPLVYAHGSASKVGIAFPAATLVIGEVVSVDGLLRIFTTAATAAADFDAGVIPASVRQQFADAGLPLAADARVARVMAGISWQIKSQDQTYGARFALSGDIELTLGMLRRRRQSFETQTGSMVEQSAVNRIADGTLETVTSHLVYAWTVPQYAGMLQTRQFDAIAETRLTNVTKNVTIASSVTTYSDQWGHAGAPFDVVSNYEWNGTGNLAPQFNYADPAANSQWVRVTQVESRASTGLPYLWRNALDVPNSQLLDRSAVRQIAAFQNADIGWRRDGSHATAECDYSGFESYEATTPWQTSAGGPIAPLITTERAHTGEASLKLSNNAGGPGIKASFAVRPGAPHVALNYWLYNDATAGPFGKITVRFNTNASYDIPFTPTGGQWQRVQRAVPIPGPAGAVTGFTLEATNAGASAAVYLDDVMVFPLPGDGTAKVFDKDTLLITAQVDANAATTRSYYDETYSALASANAEGQIVQLASGGYSRQVSGNDAFDPQHPNTSLVIQPSNGGSFETFNNDDWRASWTASPANAWSIGPATAIAGRLVLNASNGGSLTWAGGVAGDGIALRARFMPPPAAWNAPVGVKIANVGQVEWNPSASALRIVDGTGKEVSRKSLSALPAADWIVTRTGDALALYLDGQPSLAAVIPGDGGAVELFSAGNVAMAISGLTIMAAPGVALSFVDGLSFTVQQQVFTEDGTIASGALKDALGRPAISTKSMRYDDAMPGYRPSLVTGLDWSSGIMTGDVARYYNGSDGRSNDDSYPYSRVMLEMAPVERQLATGGPGAVHAIYPGATHYVETATITNVRSDFDGTVTAGIFLGSETKDNDGARIRAFTDDRLSEFYRCFISPPRFGASQRKSGRRFDDRGRLAAMVPPMAYAGGGDAYVQTRESDVLGNVLRVSSSDCGETKIIYDSLNNARFTLVADGVGTGGGGTDRIAYVRYDALGRVFETGTIDQAWNPAVLQPLANTDWPTDGQWVAKVIWDCLPQSDPTALSDPANGIGRSVEFQRPQANGTIWTLQSFYNADGSLVESVQTEADRSRRQHYDLDTAGQMVAMTFDTQNAPVTVTFSRGLQGQVNAVGDAANAKRWASYQYTAEGLPQQESLNAAAANPIQRTFRYNSLGLLTEASGDAFSEYYSYWETPGADGVTYYDGQVAKAVFEPGAAGRTAGLESDAWSNAYDANGNLSAAVNAGGPSRSMGGLADPILYDANDNMLSLMDRGLKRDFTIESGTNKTVKMATADGDETFEFSRGGNLIETDGKQFDRLSYNIATGLVTQTHLTDGSTISLDYGEGDERIKSTKLAANGTPVGEIDYLRADGGRILAQSGGDIGEMIYIPGPLGFVAVLDPSLSPGFVIRDRQNSTRLVLAESGSTLAGYAYEPFGGMAQTPVGPWSDRVRFLYIAQEYDPDTGLYNLNARLYDPVLRRFMTPDPLRSTASPYPYVSNIPFQTSDPSGLLAFLIALAIGAIVGTLIGGTVNAITYLAANDWKVKDWGDFFKDVGIGAAVGFVSGVVTVLTGGGATAGLVMAAGRIGGTVASVAATTAGRIAIGAAAGAISGALAGASGQTVSNVIEAAAGKRAWGDVLNANIGWATLTGLGVGLVFGGATSAFYFPGPRGINPSNVAKGDAYTTNFLGAGRAIRNPQPPNIDPGKSYITWRDLMKFAPRGAVDDFAPTAQIKFGLKFRVANVPRTQGAAQPANHFEVRFHSPQGNAAAGTRGAEFYTAKVGYGTSNNQLKNGANLLTDSGAFYVGGKYNNLAETHLRFRFWSWT
jgi:RHS repeat-associated protein